LPFEGETYFQTIDAITRRAAPSIRKYRRDTPKQLVEVLDKMLKKTPSARFQSAAEVAEAFGSISELGDG
jgi:hypothetical protein